MANANPATRNAPPPKAEKPTPAQVKEAKEAKLQEGFVVVEKRPSGALVTRYTGEVDG